jgi:hypothetical protein
MPEIVGVEWRDKRAGCIRDAVVACGRNALARIRQKPYPLVRLGGSLGHGAGTVGRAVIDNDHLDLVIGLTKYGLKRFGEVALAVEDWDDDANKLQGNSPPRSGK